MPSSINKIKPEPRPYLLKNKIQHYAWGARGKEAFIPQLLGMKTKKDKPYAELWIGIHPNAPSKIKMSDSLFSLTDFIQNHPVDILGQTVSSSFAGTLPFLLKVLSAGEALSIQAHPSKEQARQLHAQDPAHYPDDNHKPEIAIALDSLTALAGFKRFVELQQTLLTYPELSEFIGMDVVSAFLGTTNPTAEEKKSLVQNLYSTLITRSISHEDDLLKAINKLEHRLEITEPPLSDEEKLFLSLRKIHTGADVGLFSLFLFNLIHLKAGEAIFLEAGIPHAYIKGNIIECMANSDNVVRAGLTPKFKDAKTLVDILTYDTEPIPILGNSSDIKELDFETPAPDFHVTRWKLNSQQKRSEKTQDRIQIILITEGTVRINWNTDSQGKSEEFHKGQAILIPALLKEYDIIAEQNATVFKASVPDK